MERVLATCPRWLSLGALTGAGVLISACLAREPGPPRLAYAATDLDVRGAPSAEAPVVAEIRAGTPLAVGASQAGWCGVAVAKVAGYVPQGFLVDAPPTTRTTDQDTTRGYWNAFGEWVRSPTRTSDGAAPSGATAQCADGTYSFSNTRRGTCSWHGGVARWLPRADSIRHDDR